MSLMCKMNQTCCASKGLCSHEKMLLVIMLMMAAAAAGHWLLHWF